MLRISKLTDYGTVVMAYLASHPDQGHAAKEISEQTHIALPTVSKLLKLLAKSGLLVAQRGAKGGYSLAMPATDISLSQIINALEGDIALTACSHSNGSCAVEKQCALRSNWRTITDVLRETLSEISLVQIINPIAPSQIKNKLKVLNEYAPPPQPSPKGEGVAPICSINFIES